MHVHNACDTDLTTHFLMLYVQRACVGHVT